MSSTSSASASASSSEAPAAAGGQNTSVSAWLWTLVPTLIFAVVYYGVFLTFRKREPRVYEPRSVVKTLPPEIRMDPARRGAFGWLSYLLKQNTSFMVHHLGLDGYFHVRFIFEFMCVCILGCVILWPILFPVNATGGNNEAFFSILSYSNVSSKWRFFAHVFLSWIFFGCVVFLIYRELVYYTTFRHAAQTTPFYDSLLSSRTLLISELPKEFMAEEELRKHFPSATNIWYARKYKELQKKVKERTKLAKKYEGSANKVIRKAMKQVLKAEKKGEPAPEPADDVNTYLKGGKKRPTHRLKFLIGKKVDTLDYGKIRLGELNTEIAKDQREHEANEQLSSVFLEFPTQIELAKAYQAIPYLKEFKHSRRRSGVAPEDVVWSNMAFTKYERWLRYIGANTVLTLLVVFWCVPIFVVGAISNINFITTALPFLKFINSVPDVIKGVITGLLPVVLLAVLMALLVPFIKFMAKQSGCLTQQDISGYTQSWYYAFLVVNSFIMMTIASSSISVIQDIINNPSSARDILGKNLPQAANFFISYITLQGLAVPGSLLAQVVGLILFQFLGKILDGTPRAKWTRWTSIGSPDYGVEYATMQFLCVLALSYAMIAPLILGFAAVAYLLTYFGKIYVMTYVKVPNPVDARGRNYPKALFQLFTGLYLAQVVLIIMFAIKFNWACVALEGVSLGATVLAHLWFQRMFFPILDTVPISAIKEAAGDPDCVYPMRDQGRKEVKTEGVSYWDGGNELGVMSSHVHGQVLNDRFPMDDEKALPVPEIVQAPSTMSTDKATRVSTDTEDVQKRSPFGDDNRVSDVGNSKSKYGLSDGVNTGKAAAKLATSAPKAGLSWISRFFHPRRESFQFLRSLMPDILFQYIEYNPDFVANAYTDPAVTDSPPEIWLIKDPMGLSEIEKNQAKVEGVSVVDDNASFIEGTTNFQFDGPPPGYEEAIRA
ncbi:hypothetical protein DIURU_001642 [Diutina rugosa]|uniref:CSC1/OSCA1-like 7TM region domain-containing protein n=1 Tax=Diutina rugosa TaxID=5481 RepID=A0A642UTJ3_DIURU|nr:uncharacterized protein DIURU_001642 [Diutina rugosa]KAA8905214.1 hypothetical protein DIURU_001642 [Diutina rugosa]